MTTFAIVTPGPYIVGQTVLVAQRWDTVLGVGFRCGVQRVGPHELLVRVGGKPLAFQRHDGTTWSWCQPEQTSFEVGDEQQGRLV